MILRRIAEAIRQRNWFTVLFEIMIVVLGVFLGLQANNWNEARADRERSEQYVARIRADLVADMTELQRHRAFWELVTNEGYAAIRYAETGDMHGLTAWALLRAFLHASQAWQFTFVDATYAELRSAGQLGLIPDPEMRNVLADYYVAVALRRGGLGPYHLLPEYRELVRGRMRSDIMRYYGLACFEQAAGVQRFVECPPPQGVSDTVDILEQLAADPEIVDALRYWIDTQRMTVELAGFDLGRAQRLINRLDALR